MGNHSPSHQTTNPNHQFEGRFQEVPVIDPFEGVLRPSLSRRPLFANTRGLFPPQPPSPFWGQWKPEWIPCSCCCFQFLKIRDWHQTSNFMSNEGFTGPGNPHDGSGIAYVQLDAWGANRAPLPGLDMGSQCGRPTVSRLESYHFLINSPNLNVALGFNA